MRPSWMVLAMGVFGVLPEWAAAQTPFNANPSAPDPETATVGGTPTIDLILLREGKPGAPLRFGGVVPGSERVELDGRKLQRGVDYQIDNSSGVVYLTGGFRAGQSLIVVYRYDKARQGPENRQAFGLGSLRFDLVPQSLSVVVGFGMTERLADGNVLTSNIYGLNNNFNFGQGSLKGLYLLGERDTASAKSMFEFSQPGQVADVGHSRLMLQNLSSRLGGGTVEATYQDVSKNFSAFGSAREAGYDDATVQRLQKEKGMQRMGFDMKDVKFGGLKFGQSFKSISDGDSSIDWRSFSLGVGGFSAFYGSQKVEDSFKRFKDIAEGERNQLAKEAGMFREDFGFGFASGMTKLSFKSNGIYDQNDSGVVSRLFNLETKGFKLNLGDQDVDKAFGRINSLTDAERNRLAREVGTKRKWLDFSASIPGSKEPLKFAQSSLESETGKFESQDVGVAWKGWKLEHSERNIGEGFASLSALQDAERADHLKAIANMYQPGGFAVGGDEANRFLAERGLSRSMTRLSLAPSAGWQLVADTFRMDGMDGGASVDTVNLSSKILTLSFRRQDMDGGSSLINSLMNFERQRLGVLPGLNKTDFSAALKLGGKRTLTFNQMAADSPEGGASRQALTYSDGKLDLAINRREVDNGFTGVGQLVDPEKDLLTTLRGFDETDIRAKWQFLPGMRLDVFSFDGNSDALNQTRFNRNYTLTWNPDKKTEIALVRLHRRDDDPFQLLFGNTLDLFNFARDFGRLGRFTYQHQATEFDGAQSTQPDSEKQYMAYETKLNPKTSFKTEQTLTNFDNGGKENISANTLTTEVAKNAGVSVTDVNIDRGGDAKNEKKRQYGFWVIFGGGLRLAYGMDRNIGTTEQTSGQNQNASITPGTSGNVNIGQASYTESRIDSVNTKAAGNIQVSTAKPFSLGFISDLKLQAGFDSQGDTARLVKENANFRMSGKLGSSGFMLEYKSQVHQSGFRAIDRAFEFTTDQDEKRPLRFSVKYRMRNLPWDEQVMVRDYALSWKPAKDVLLTHNLITNPLVDKGDALLGTVTQAKQLSRWKLDFNSKSDVKVGGQWEEVIDEQRPRFRTGGVNLTLFARSPSPLHLFFGVEQSDAKDGARTTANRYSLKFDQRAGPNQMFSFFLGNVSYQRSLINGKDNQNWTVRVDYQWRF